jgi:DNA-binding NtrC family response regulator
VTDADTGVMAAGESGQRSGRVLLVDDDSGLAAYLVRMLRERGGFEVTHELDAEGALRRVEAEPWDLLIADIELPGISGLELLERVREMAPGLPVAVITGYPSFHYAVCALRGAAAEFLSKPVHPRELVARVTRLITDSREARAVGPSS